MLNKFKEGSIRWQIVTLAVLPIVLVGVLGILSEPIFPEESKLSRAEIVAAQIALVADQVENAATKEQVDAVLTSTRGTGLWVQTQEIEMGQPTTESFFERRVLHALSDIHGREAAAVTNNDGALHIIVHSREELLGFVPPVVTGPNLANDDVTNIILSVIIIGLPVTLLSIYAARLIANPLTAIAAAAQVQNTGASGSVFKESGPLEIRQLARRLNEMRSQIQEMVSERTAMLRAVSHDLRTPLTRLKMRVERSVPQEVGALLLRDIGAINDMIDDTLSFLRSEAEIEASRKVDLPSLLRTISTDFTDIGNAVTYTGPDRLAFVCQPRAISRAVSNLVDNATKHGSHIEIALVPSPQRGVRIEVSDDGPGIPDELRSEILKPFVTGDRSRTPSPRSGFGLGLAIAQDIARRHGGALQMADRESGGFTVVILLPLLDVSSPTRQLFRSDRSANTA